MECQDNACEIYDSTLLHKLFIYWETRDLGIKIDRLVTILAVSIFFDKAIYPSELAVAKKILEREIKHKGKVDAIFEKLKLKLGEYITDYNKYLQDRDKAFSHIKDDVQLYGMMRDVFEAEGLMSDEEKLAEEIVKREYDKSYKLDHDGDVFAAHERKWK